MRPKQGLLLFITSCLSGCGQMYQGYMKRGVSLLLGFFVILAIAGFLGLGAVAFFLPVVWLYAFFDSYNLRSRILDGTAPQDEYLFGLSEMDSQRMAELLRRRHSVIGWGLVMIGIYLLYQMLLNQLWWMMGDWFLGDWLYSLLRYDVPRIFRTLSLRHRAARRPHLRRPHRRNPMTKTSEIRQAPAQRRVGTLTLGATLIVAGGVMMVSLFWPEADLRWAVKASPLILISLGVETLLAARSGSRIKYDWAGMVLCFVLVAAAMCLYTAAWWMAWLPEHGSYFDGSRTGDESSLMLDYTAFNGTDFQLLEMESGDVIRMEIVNDQGSVDVSVIEDEDREPVFDSEALATGSYSIEIPRDGSYELWVTGHQAAGSAYFRRERAA